MRPLTDKYRLQGFSLPEIKQGLDLTALEMELAVERFFGRKLKGSHVINVLVLHFLKRMTDEERMELLEWGLPELERLQMLEAPEPIRGTHIIHHPKNSRRKKPDASEN
jgi:hypothetical protein